MMYNTCTEFPTPLPKVTILRTKTARQYDVLHVHVPMIELYIRFIYYCYMENGILFSKSYL